MSMLDSFFNKGFKGAKCKTLLKLSIPRIKLLRNRREIQIKQMRRDIAKLLETGQEATARIRVEHIIREENMMAAQEILELFCELIAVRLPIIETQRECPIDLKEAISSICFAAPRCADLPELLQVQMQFATKYGREFVAAATELMPDCGVNRQLVELLSVRAPSAEKKLKLLKEIAEEHELDWDPAATETDFFKPKEDLLNGSTQFVSGSKMPLPKEKHEEMIKSAGETDSDKDLDLDFPEVPTIAPKPNVSGNTATEATPQFPSAPHPGDDHGSSERSPHFIQMEPFPTAPHPTMDHQSSIGSGSSGNFSQELHMEPHEVVHIQHSSEMAQNAVSGNEDRQFLPFVSPPAPSPASIPEKQTTSPPSLSTASIPEKQNTSPPSPSPASIPEKRSTSPPTASRTKSETNVDLQDVLAAAHAAAETAERAAAAARTAASLAQMRISELTQKRNDSTSESGNENPFHKEELDPSTKTEKFHPDRQVSSNDLDSSSKSPDPRKHHEDYTRLPDDPAFEEHNADFDSSPSHLYDQEHQPQRLNSMEDEPYYSYPNLFSSGAGGHSFKDTRSPHDV